MGFRPGRSGSVLFTTSAGILMGNTINRGASSSSAILMLTLLIKLVTLIDLSVEPTQVMPVDPRYVLGCVR